MANADLDYIIVEDGTGLPNANSYINVLDTITYASRRNVDLTQYTDEQIGAWLLQATDYLQSYECEYIGVRLTSTQALSWPRTQYDPSDYCQPVVPTGVPSQIIAAQCQLVLAQEAGYTLLPNYGNEDYVTRETVGPITVQYADPIATGLRPRFTAVDAMLAPLFGKCATTDRPVSFRKV